MHLGTAFPCFLSAALLLAACAEDKSPLDSYTSVASVGPTGSPSGGPSGDPSGDASGGTETDGGTDSATGGVTEGSGATDTGGTGEHGACDQLLLCIGVIAPDALPEAEQSYGPNSTCWQTTPEIAQMCKDACAAALESYGSLYPDEPACGGTPGTTTTDSGPSTSTTDPWTSTTDPWTSTTDPSTSTTDPSTSSTTGAGDYGNCGWDAGNAYYACGFLGADPDGVSPIDCPPDLPQSGDACTEDGPITGIGCCLPNGDNYYCLGGMISVDACG